MMQSAEDRCGDDSSGSLHGSSQWRVLTQPQVRASLIVVERIQLQNPAQMPLAEDQDVIQTVSTHCTDQRSRKPWGVPLRAMLS
jgi:hypothetical protein